MPIPPERPAVPRLPAEVLILIFEELARTSNVANLRLVSQKFEDLAAPIFYRHLTLTIDLIVRFTTPYRLRFDKSFFLAHQKMKLCTKHLVLGIVVDWEPVIQLVLSLDKLQYIT